jgi:lysozyme
MGILEDLKRDEGFKSKPYRCTAGKLTIGYGRNLEDVGISEVEAEIMLNTDIAKAEHDLRDIFRNWNSYPEGKKDALINMRFNLGYSGFRQFKKMIAAIKVQYWGEAARQAKDSKWYNQVGERAIRIIEKLKEGKDEK